MLAKKFSTQSLGKGMIISIINNKNSLEKNNLWFSNSPVKSNMVLILVFLCVMANYDFGY